MLRNLFVTLGCLLALTAPAFGAIWWDGGCTGCNFEVQLDISGWAQVICQDNTIVFSTETCEADSGDWHCTQLCGVGYAHDYDKSSQDAWAEGYFESYDDAYLFFRSNADIYCKIDPDGNLKNDGDEIDTWFTLSATGETGQGPLLDGVYKSDGGIPLDQEGCYASDEGGDKDNCCSTVDEDGIMELCDGTCFYPEQYCFTMAGTGNTPGDYNYWYLNLPAPCGGTLLWAARVHRQGMKDPAGAYTANIAVDFFEGAKATWD
jgi:hypothetical protein